MEKKYIQLIQSEIDNENSLDASKSFRELINKNSKAKDLMLDIKSLVDELSYLGEKLLISKSSTEIKKNIITAIELDSKNKKQTISQTKTINGDIMAKSNNKITMSNFISAAIGAAAMYLILFASNIEQPSTNEISGTIGGDPVERAVRYRATQVTQADITLENQEMQQLLQDKTFMDLVESGELTNLSQNESFVQLMASPDFFQLFASPNFNQMIASPDFAQLMANHPENNSLF